MYCSNPHQSKVFQGDVLVDIPLVSIPDISKLTTNPEKIEVPISRSKVLVLSQTCDIERRPKIIVCEVFPLTLIEALRRQQGKSDEKILNELSSIRLQQMNYLFHLQPYGSQPEAYADFTLIHSVDPSLITTNKRVASLSHAGRHWLGYSLAQYFGRPFIEALQEVPTSPPTTGVTPG